MHVSSVIFFFLVTSNRITCTDLAKTSSQSSVRVFQQYDTAFLCDKRRTLYIEEQRQGSDQVTWLMAWAKTMTPLPISLTRHSSAFHYNIVQNILSLKLL